MPSPIVETSSPAEISGSGAWTPTMPTGIVSGDGIIAVLGRRHDEGDTPGEEPVPTGYTDTGDINESVSNRVWVFHRQATGDSNDDITYPASTAFIRKTTIIHRISGQEDFATQVPELSTGDVGVSSDAPDPPSFSPTGGSDDYLAIAVGQIRTSAATQALTSNPSGYTAVEDIMTTGSDFGVITATARLAFTAASEDPGAWDFVLASRFIGFWIAVHPSVAAADVVFRRHPTTNSVRM